MTLESDLLARLDGFAGLTALVSTRSYHLHLPQKPTYPAVTFQRISTERVSAMGADTGDVRARIQTDAWATTIDSAMAVAAQVRAALKRYGGTNSVTIYDILQESEIPLYEDEIQIYHIVQDFMVLYKET